MDHCYYAPTDQHRHPSHFFCGIDLALSLFLEHYTHGCVMLIAPMLALWTLKEPAPELSNFTRVVVPGTIYTDRAGREPASAHLWFAIYHCIYALPCILVDCSLLLHTRLHIHLTSTGVGCGGWQGDDNSKFVLVVAMCLFTTFTLPFFLCAFAANLVISFSINNPAFLKCCFSPTTSPRFPSTTGIVIFSVPFPLSCHVDC